MGTMYLRLTNFRHHAQHHKEERAHQKAEFGVEGKHARALPCHVWCAGQVGQRYPEYEFSQQSAAANITANCEDAQHNAKVQNVAVRQTGDERPNA